MRTYDKQFTAAGTAIFALAARYFRLMSVAVGQVVNVNLYRNGTIVYEAVGVETGFYSVPKEGFDRVEITTAVAQTVKFAVSDGFGGYDKTTDAVSVVGNVSVVPVAGGTIANGAAVAVGTAAVVAAASGGRRAIYFRAAPTNTDAIYLGSSAVTVANAAIKLNPGDTYIEDNMAAAAWYAISSTAAQSLKVMTGI